MIHHARRLGIAIAADLLAQRIGVPVGLGASAAWAAQFGAETAIGGVMEAVSGRDRSGPSVEGRKLATELSRRYGSGQHSVSLYELRREDFDRETRAMKDAREIVLNAPSPVLAEPLVSVLHVVNVTANNPRDWTFEHHGNVCPTMRAGNSVVDIPHATLREMGLDSLLRVKGSGQATYDFIDCRVGRVVRYRRCLQPLFDARGRVERIVIYTAIEPKAKIGFGFLSRRVNEPERFHLPGIVGVEFTQDTTGAWLAATIPLSAF